MSRRTLHLRGASSQSTSASQTTTTPFPYHPLGSSGPLRSTTTPLHRGRIKLSSRCHPGPIPCQTRQIDVPDEVGARARIHKMSLPPEIAQVDADLPGRSYPEVRGSKRSSLKAGSSVRVTRRNPGSREGRLTEWREQLDKNMLSPLTTHSSCLVSLAFLFPTHQGDRGFTSFCTERHPSPARCWSGRGCVVTVLRSRSPPRAP